MTKKPKYKYACTKRFCLHRFTSWQARDAHVRDVHPEPPPPKVIRDERYISEDWSQQVKDGDKIKVGQTIKITKVCVVKRVRVTEGSTVGTLDLDVISNTWEHEPT